MNSELLESPAEGEAMSLGSEEILYWVWEWVWSLHKFRLCVQTQRWFQERGEFEGGLAGV